MAQLCCFAILTLLLMIISPCIGDENFGSNCLYNGYDAPCNSSATNLISETCDPRSGGNYTRNSVYESNLLSVFSNLTSAAASSKTFYNASAGSGEDQVFGLFYCRGDVDPKRCLSCVQTGVSHLKACDAREALAYYEQCTLRYAKRAIFGSVELNQGYHPCEEMMAGPNTPNQSVFNKTVEPVMERLTDKVTSGNSSSYFATESTKLFEHQKVYVLVQCRPDLTGSRCQECLREAMEALAANCLGRGQIWGMYFQPSCQIRYDVVPFFNTTTLRTSPPASIGFSPRTSYSPGRRPASLWSAIAATIVLITSFNPLTLSSH